MKSVSFLIFPGFNILDLAGPLSVFEAANREGNHYRIQVLSEGGGMVPSSSGLAVQSHAMRNARLQIVIVPGGEGVSTAATPGVLQLLRRTASKERLASVCTGAFLLAAAGVLDGRRASTHWASAVRLQASYPRVDVVAEQIIVKDERIWSSAGSSAGIDLALSMVEHDYGEDLAREVAGQLVVYYRRPGGQGQFMTMRHVEGQSQRIRAALAYCRAHLDESLPLERIAAVAHLGERQFTRRFIAETGMTPSKAVERLRVEAARTLLEAGERSVERIASDTGFADTERMRRAFHRVLGQPPQAIKQKAKPLPPPHTC